MVFQHQSADKEKVTYLPTPRKKLPPWTCPCLQLLEKQLPGAPQGRDWQVAIVTHSSFLTGSSNGLSGGLHSSHTQQSPSLPIVSHLGRGSHPHQESGDWGGWYNTTNREELSEGEMHLPRHNYFLDYYTAPLPHLKWIRPYPRAYLKNTSTAL